MAKRHHELILTKPMPSAKVPLLVILCLLTGIVLVYMGFLRSPDKLLGPPLEQNDYLPDMLPPKPKHIRQQVIPRTSPNTPAMRRTPTGHTSSTTTPPVEHSPASTRQPGSR